MRRIKVKLQYDGTFYQGWQVQPSGTTIQGMLQESILRITGEPATFIGAGRTDAGVHAVAQIASFDSSSRLDNVVIKRALNALLPPDVRIIALEDCSGEFHPRYSALRKRYFYLIANTDDVPVFFGRYVWWVRAPLDVEGMKAASGFLRGRHDFSSFRGAGCGAKSPVREVYSLETERFGELAFLSARFSGNFIKISLEGDGFLRHMVRNIVGTLVEVGRGRIQPDAVGNILLSRDRRRAGQTAPAKGLFLDRVIYAL
ncbi:MAG TPA: tRNA pseudouridine(38-40) synthase TruA [Nitrospiraceae bacterium]|jgi:tRNA pseudouridine38-40 synthase|nr:tRNA pseudouridine(38-40) synthase TruA [Nitrospiraceae bacterium]